MLLILAFLLLAFALLRWVNVTRQMVELRRARQLAAQLDWSRAPPLRRAAPKKGRIAQLLR